ncbi:uncharacterized protein LOC125518344 [Triticum urartu]|uniref:uncharacterized protein LOC125518344 n=1 Tax=Triticum urartu TaxID=4572 RepID=UPI0020440C02|nr:uncharacterized protein LOC125518344 [Triticum urartu]
MMEAAMYRHWSDLQPELLGLVLKHLPSLSDRVRLRAVCRTWRSNSMLQPLPLPFPWLTLPDGTFLSIPGSEIHRIPVPEGACCQGSIDNWLFLIDNGNVCSLMNPFSKTALELPNLVAVWEREIRYHSDRKPIFYKLVVPSPLDSSPHSPVVALIMDDGCFHTLCISQPPIATGSLRDNKDPRLFLSDVVFFNGKLYAWGRFGQLFIVDLDNDRTISSISCIIDSLGDIGGTPQDLSIAEEYMVFEADLHTSPGRWRKATELGGHALFLGQHGSKCLPAVECSGYHEDCIYFMCDYVWPTSSANPLCDSGVYSMRDGTITPLMSEAAAAPLQRVGQWRPTWFFPPQAV